MAGDGNKASDARRHKQGERQSVMSDENIKKRERDDLVEVLVVCMYRVVLYLNKGILIFKLLSIDVALLCQLDLSKG